MMNAPEGAQEIENLMNEVSSHCESGNFIQFMNCFTKKKSATIRQTMKELFSRHRIKMDIFSVEVVESKNNYIKFKLKYGWDADNVIEKIIANALVVAKKENNSWKIDSEEIVDFETISKVEQNQNINFGGGGQVVLNPVNDDFLPRDIATRPGGCANGQCNIR